MTKQEEFLALYEPVHERFERFCRARVYGNLDYRDLMNDTLIVAYTKIDELKSNDAFVYFLFGIAVRILSNNKRKKHEERIHNDQAILASSQMIPILKQKWIFIFFIWHCNNFLRNKVNASFFLRFLDLVLKKLLKLNRLESLL